MISLTRKIGEEVVIGDPENPSGTVRVVGIKGGRVRLAFDFPREVDVYRKEVAGRILAERQDNAPPAGGADTDILRNYLGIDGRIYC